MRQPDPVLPSPAQRDGRACSTGNKRNARGRWRWAAGTLRQWEAAILILFAITGLPPAAARPTPRAPMPDGKFADLQNKCLCYPSHDHETNGQQPWIYTGELCASCKGMRKRASTNAASCAPSLTGVLPCVSVLAQTASRHRSLFSYQLTTHSRCRTTGGCWMPQV
jgi:hypothetical protein